MAASYSEARSSMAKSLGQLRRKYVAADAAAVSDTFAEKPKRPLNVEVPVEA
ncbi:hypothetical protein ACRAWG_36550 [Methylobacterium sp. P31]